MITVNLGKFILTKNITNLETFDETQCVTEFCFAKRDVPWLSEALQLPHEIVCYQEICTYY